ncbi:hypothetical protein M3Y94_00983400 [Aphelenchoides besseyi]|nr:hypothetical protein M3Y94_00983400 [Aphelenchoides besseyi]KAI6221080.1 Saposin-like type B, 1 domain and Saposin B domain and Saposin-like domain-containing protein [Aphelenchoides besseyi]
MKFVFALLLLATVGLASINDDKSMLLNDNRVPKTANFKSVCDECESLIKRIVDVAQDPGKLAELKILLSALCHETSYEEECRVFVSKIDFFIKELLPYMKDAHKVCRDIHLCSNKKIDVFHRVGMIYAKKYLNKVDGANDLICEECQFAAHELQSVVDSHQVQVDVRKFLSDNVCEHLGQYRGSCDVLLDDFLPDLFQELHNLLAEPREFCEHIDLCKATAASLSTKHKEEHEEKLEPGAWIELMENLNSIPVKHPSGFSTAGCLTCRVSVETLLLHLADDATTKALGYDLRDAVCPRLPVNMLDGCIDFLKLYAPTVVKLTVGQVTAEQICDAIHICDDKSFDKSVALDELKGVTCEACTEASKSLEIALESRTMRKRLIHEAKHFVCDKMPSLKYPCSNLMRSYIPLMLTKILQRLQNNELCHVVRACN